MRSRLAHFMLLALISCGAAGGPSAGEREEIVSSAVTARVLVDCGSSAASPPFVADEDFTNGATINHANTIDTSKVNGPAPAAVYQTARIGNFTYTVPGFAASSATVRLHFAETYFSTTGSRVFNVSINGSKVLTNFDILKAAGAPNRAYIAQFTASGNASGGIVIQFTSVVNKSLVSGIEIDPVAGSDGGADGGCTTNACGGCGALGGAPGAPCGNCGTLVCSSTKSSLSCSDPGMNACGGCGPLGGAPGAPCGNCGTLVCSSTKSSLSCSDPGMNACGGCGILGGAPGSPCGNCGTLVCSSGGASVVCSDPCR